MSFISFLSSTALGKPKYCYILAQVRLRSSLRGTKRVTPYFILYHWQHRGQRTHISCILRITFSFFVVYPSYSELLAVFTSLSLDNRSRYKTHCVHRSASKSHAITINNTMPKVTLFTYLRFAETLLLSLCSNVPGKNRPPSTITKNNRQLITNRLSNINKYQSHNID